MLLPQFNETIDTWINALNDYTPDLLRQHPQQGAWSLGQVYMHIIDDTTYFVERIKEALLSKENAEKEMHAGGKTLFNNNQFPDIRIEGPATGKFIPQPESIDELRQKLVYIKNEINDLYAQYDFSDSGKTAHPGLGFFSAAEWLQFAEMHMRHHFRQKNRIDAFLGLTNNYK